MTRVSGKKVIELLLIAHCRKSPYLTLDTAALFVGAAVMDGHNPPPKPAASALPFGDGDF